jgi:ATP-dependent DNA helicase RecG
MALHINIEDLLSARTVESDRIEFKKGWNPDAIYRSICAFANDFDNTGGGYILIGVEENEINKIAQRPVIGLSSSEIADIQRKMIGLNNLIEPVYHAKLFIENIDNQQIIVLWCIGGTNRPYEVPEQVTASTKRSFYYIRKYANSVKANQEEQQELISMTNQTPFDDRVNQQATEADISMVLLKDYLKKIKSKLAEQIGEQKDIEILRQMELVSGPDEHPFPRNVGLMMFSENPEKYFPYTQVEVVYFPNGEAEPFTEFDKIKGPIPSQVKNTLDLLKSNFLKETVTKQNDQPESIRIWNYPILAIEEILVNAFYHRDYQVREPIEIRVYQNSIMFLNNGGPDRSVKMQAFKDGLVKSRRYRNRRLGDFLKELELTEGRATGVPTILNSLKNNGSPLPRFETDDDRTYMLVELFIHEAFAKKPNIIVNIDKTINDIIDIDKVLNGILLHSNLDANVIASTIAEDVDFCVEMLDNESVTISERLNDDVVSVIAGVIAKIGIEREVKLLKKAKIPNKRDTMLKAIKLQNFRKNYNDYLKPLIELNWIAMTHPTKPTSPNQQYYTTLKGRLVLGILKWK